MNIRTRALLAGLLSLAFSSSALAQQGIVWTDITGGTLAGSSVSVSGFGTGNQILPYDLSGSNYSGAPLSTNQNCMDHHANDPWTAVFTPPINNGLLWYGKYTRGADAYAGGGLVEYTFNHPFVILSGFAQGTVTGNTLAVPEPGVFHHGILQFSGPVGTLTCTTNATGFGYQACTLGQMGSLDPGTQYCPGDGSGTACPCGNNNDGSIPESGCANGVFASGAQLTGSGYASVSADTLVLATTGLEPSNSGLYFQANNDLSPGIVWGDGLQCAGGQLKRLGVRFSDANGASDTSGYPQPISVKAGNVLAGDTKYYQCWYRNPNGSPCASDFNASNGLAVTWMP